MEGNDLLAKSQVSRLPFFSFFFLHLCSQKLLRLIFSHFLQEKGRTDIFFDVPNFFKRIDPFILATKISFVPSQGPTGDTYIT